METSLMVNDYPEPEEEQTKTITAKVTVSYIIEGEVPSDYETLDIERDIKEYFTEYKFLEEDIDDIEIL